MYKCIKKELLKLYVTFDKISKVYTRKDGRQHIVLNNLKLAKKHKDKLKTISFPKALMESYIGRKLLKNETVDHIDKNPLNNELNNLQIIDRVDHVKLDVIRRKPIIKNCDNCGKEFELSKAQVTDRNTGRSLVSFCSRKCSGNYRKQVRLGTIKPITREKGLVKEYYSNKQTNK